MKTKNYGYIRVGGVFQWLNQSGILPNLRVLLW